MPIFDYKCIGCGNIEERMVSLFPGKQYCECETEMKKLISKAHVRGANTGDRNAG